MVSEITLVVSIILVLFGMAVIIIRKTGLMGKENEWFLDSLEWFIIGTSPLIPASELLPTHREWADVFVIGYVCIIVSWFLILWLTKKKTQKKEHPILLAANIVMFGGMIGFVILTWQALLQ